MNIWEKSTKNFKSNPYWHRWPETFFMLFESSIQGKHYENKQFLSPRNNISFQKGCEYGLTSVQIRIQPFSLIRIRINKVIESGSTADLDKQKVLK
jgi:hypothetical protein